MKYRINICLVLLMAVGVILIPARIFASVEIIIEGQDRRPARGSFEYLDPEYEPGIADTGLITSDVPELQGEVLTGVQLRRDQFTFETDYSAEDKRIRINPEPEDDPESRTRRILGIILGVAVVGILLL